MGFEIEVLGVLTEGQQVYAPYADTFEYKTAPRIRDLPKLATGDLIYSFKPLTTSLLPAMLASGFGLRKPVLLDIEDDDLLVCQAKKRERLARFFTRAFRSPKSVTHGLTHLTRMRCTATTVSTTLLKSFYGGTLLIHGPDEQKFDPARLGQDQASLRKAFGLPEGKILVLFAGFPRPHKGIGEIIDAVERTDSVLVLAGPLNDAFFAAAKERLGEKCILLGMVSNEKMPNLLAAVDVVPVPQHDVSYARAQLPAKLIEAMAMGKSVVVTQIGDLPLLVGEKTENVCGWVVPPNDSQALATAIDKIVSSPSLVAERNSNARKFYEANASVSANAKILRDIFQSIDRLRPYLETSPSGDR